MGFFDFLKRKELSRISELEEQLSQSISLIEYQRRLEELSSNRARIEQIKDSEFQANIDALSFRLAETLSEREKLERRLNESSQTLDSTKSELASSIRDLENRIKDSDERLVKYLPIIDLEKELQNLRKQFEKDQDREIAQLKERIEGLNAEVDSLSQKITAEKQKLSEIQRQYAESREVYSKLREQIHVYESKLDFIEVGVYAPIYDFAKSDEYRDEQNRVIGLQKDMIQADTAMVCTTKWTVDNSESKGQAMINRWKKLMLRAFNGECDALIAKVKWNNVNQLRERLTKIAEAINKLGANMSISISSRYIELKHNELTLEYEFQSKRQREKEEMRAIQEEIREEERARREFEIAQRQAEKESLNYQKALEKARREVEEATGAKQVKLQAQIDLLQQQLAAAEEKGQRAISMAQQTKRGHVYIISNIGSFGEDIFKIGMTRRLDPMDRVKELGDASVPFQFDTHAMIFCEDAPALEIALHRAFTDRKVNMLNYRKEFFNVSIDEIESKIAELGFEAQFTRLAEAMEYRETVAILAKLKTQVQPPSIVDLVESEFPAELASMAVDAT